MTTRYFCTLFDSNYLLKGLAMINSLAQFCPNIKIYVLCMDLQTRRILEKLNLSYVFCLNLQEIETQEILKAKADRGVAEYCWTLSSCFTWYVMQNYSEIDLLTYVDSDLLFYSDVQPLFDEIGDASIAIIEHRFTEQLKDLEVNGRFCVEWNSFRRDEQGIICLSRWREQCIEWCYYRLEDGKMGDQKYLDEWPYRYPNCHILVHPGAGIAPWNYAQYRFDQSDSGFLTVNEVPLIFYHFHQFQVLQNGQFDRLSSFYTSECPEPDMVYKTYEGALMAALNKVLLIDPEFARNFKAPYFVNARRFMQKYIPGKIKNYLRFFIKL